MLQLRYFLKDVVSWSTTKNRSEEKNISCGRGPRGNGRQLMGRVTTSGWLLGHPKAKISS